MNEEQFRSDFLAYSGGFLPTEAHDEMMTYLETEAWMDPKVSRDVVDDWFDQWLDELGD